MKPSVAIVSESSWYEVVSMRILESAPRSETVPANVAEFVMTSVVPLEITTLPVNSGGAHSASEPLPMIVNPPSPVHGMSQ